MPDENVENLPPPQPVCDRALAAYRAIQSNEEHRTCCAGAENICVSGLNHALRIAFDAGKKAAKLEIAKSPQGSEGIR